MQINAAVAAFLLQSAAIPCLARSTQRSIPPNALELHSVLNTSLLDPGLPIATIPYEVSLHDSFDTKLRIISYTAPHLESFDLLPCIVDMMSTAFTHVWKNQEPHPRLPYNQYSFSNERSFGLNFVGNQITAPLEYSDLISLARMLIMFQQSYTMPGLQFEYWVKGRMLGQGHAWMQFAEVGNRTGEVSQM